MTSSPRIVSFLPSATEIACALGLQDSLLGITHECDYPPEVKTKPVVVRNVLPIETMSQGEIDRAVAERMRAGLSLYQIDEQLLHELAPDLILTQDLCQVCAPSGNEVSQVLKSLPKTPQILWMTPRNVGEIFDNVRDLGAATGRTNEAAKLIDDYNARIEALSRKTAQIASRPRVFCMEWLDPVYASGHWVPELVAMAGGVDDVGRKGGESVRVSWDDVAAWAPEVLVIMPCGFNLQQTMKQIWTTFGPYGSRAGGSHFFELPAVRNGRVYAVDANSYFARPGPRVVEGAELLAQLIHPDLFDTDAFAGAHQRVDVDLLKGALVEGKDYRIEAATGAIVFTAGYLQRRGYCCDSGCRNCPY
ncbi:MAG TPA: ABC transporter substrate-binding protein [Pyrinomonadaceae bacterium]|nr:ABC transporter substrate-binding protein [Pyrinomonadaceae bacterium]